VLAKLKDPRVMGALGRAASDDSRPEVRVYVLKLVARNPGGDSTDQRARAVLGKALSDPSPQVRAQAARSLAELNRARTQLSTQAVPAATGARTTSGGAGAKRKGPLIIAVRTMGDRTGKAPPALRERMKAEIIGNLRREPNLEVAEPTQPGIAYVVDGTIARLEHGIRGMDVESVCGIELVVSRPPRGIVLVAGGEAAVQKPRIHFRPTLRAPMDAEALEHAVRSAHENLARYLSAQ
jgi:hypothetical protein